MGVEIKEYRLKRKKIHSSWLIATISVAFIVGSHASLYTTFFARVEWLIFGACIGILSVYRNKYAAIMLVSFAGLLLGLSRAGIELNSQNELKKYYGQELEIAGVVADDPTYDIDGDMRIKIVDVRINELPQAGVVWVSTSDDALIKRSDQVLVSGKIVQGFGTIVAAMYQAEVQKLIRQDFADVGRDVRDTFSEGIRAVVREPEASLGAGFLLGQTSELPEKLDNELRLLGLTHIVVASGYNLTILIRFARRLFARISRFTGLATSVALVFGFAAMTGFSPSMTRASFIATMSLLAWYYGRKYHPFVLLSFSAAVTVMINPSYAWGDIGWLLSFASFIGVIIVSPLIHAYFWGDKKPGNVRQVFIETMSAQLATLPIIAYVFGQYSSLALIANVLILPIIPIAMLFTFVGGLAGLLSLPFDALVGLPAQTMLRYVTSVVDRLSLLPQASAEVDFSMNAVIMFYIALFSVIIFLWRRTGYTFRDYNIVE